MNNTGMIRALMKAGLIAELVHAAILLAIWALQEPILRITSPAVFENMERAGFLPLMLMPLLSLCVYMLLYYLLKTHLDTNAPPTNAGFLLGMAIGAPILMNVISLLFHLARNVLIGHMTSAMMLAQISALSTYMSWFGFLSTFAALSMAAAAGMLWQRAHNGNA